MRLRAIAHSRTGDKGDTSNIAVFAYDAKDYPLLERHVTAERVREHFAEIVRGEVVRYAAVTSAMMARSREARVSTAAATASLR